jgi:ATP-dependent exoDNAse (exonuclease V) beta subunit
LKFKKNLALEASAGSGKTFALTVRYIALLLQGSKPPNILALTFTKKAANEMKTRVFNTLQNLQNPKYENELNELCEILSLTKEEILKRREQIIERFLNANVKISTIDAFLTQILRKFSLHLGLMPDFTNDEKTAQARLEKRFIKNAQKQNVYDSLVFFASVAKRSFGDVFSFFLKLYEKDSEIENLTFERTFFPSEDEVLKKCKEIKEYLILQNASNVAMRVFSVENIEEFVGKDILEERETLNYRTFSKVYSPKLDEMYFELKEEICKFYRQKERFWLGELFFLYNLYKNSRLDEAKNNSELSFNDVANIVYNLLNKYIDNEFLYFRLDAQIEHLLVDEFQDTNIVQFKILQPIIKEIISGVGTRNLKSFFYVGDKKQSIYRFRGGAKVLFDYIAKTFDIEIDSLPKNYRSLMEIVEFVNRVFLDKIKEYKNQIAIKNGGFVEVCTCEELLEEINVKVEYLFKNGVKQDDIAILCIKNDDAEAIKNSLQERFKDIKVNTESNLKLTHSQNVKKIIEFLKYLYFKEELYGRNFQVLIGESFETLPDISGFSKGDEPLVIINRCIENFKIDTYDVDIFRFLEIVANFNDLESLLFSLETLSANSIKKDAQGIKILTIHKSKGLEFDTVLVVDRIGKKNNSQDFLLFDYDGVKLENIFINMTKREFVDDKFKKARQKEEILQEEDTLNQQYVAFTRAKNNLFILKKDKNSYFDNLLLEDLKLGDLCVKESLQTKEETINLEYEHKFFGKQDVEKKDYAVEGNFENIYFGLALHFTLEMMNEYSEDELENSLIFTKNKFSNVLDNEAFNSIKKRVSNLLKDSKFIEILKSGEIYKEQPFMFKQKRGQIDLLVKAEDKIYLIDYKTSPFAKSSHIKQVTGYKEAFSNFEDKDVEALLFYLHEDNIEKIVV